MARIQAQLRNIRADRLQAMIEADDKRSGIPIEVKVDDLPPFNSLWIEGEAHAVMRVIGLLADHGEDCLNYARAY